MIEEKELPKIEIEAPSKAKIAKAAAAALALAVVILVTAVLPAEYGIDPVGAGAALGLLNLSTGTEAAAPAPVPAPVQVGVYTAQPSTYKVDSEDITLFPSEGVEIKYHMDKGAGMVYSWKSNGKVLFEFHGEPDQKPNPEYYESYELDDKVGRDQSYGSFTAPTTGIHGWFWENKGDKPVTIHLTTAGFYSGAKMFSSGGAEDLEVNDAK